MRSLLALVAILATSCASTSELVLAPADQPVASAQAVVGQGTVLIEDPSPLPEALRRAAKLEAVVGGAKVPVTRTATGALSFAAAANVKLDQDLEGTIRVPFVVDDARLWLVLLKTAPSLRFEAPPVTTAPQPALVTRGFPVQLTAATAGTDATHQFGWSFGAAATGPWQALPEAGKQITWKPPTAGNFFLKVDALDRARGRAQTVVTPTATVFVRDPGNVVVATPPGGAVDEGVAVRLKFVPPPELAGQPTHLAWAVGTSVQGPWTPIAGQDAEVGWLPTAAGSFFAKVDAVAGGEAYTFISPTPVAFATVDPTRIAPVEATVGRATPLRFTPPAAIADRAGRLVWSVGANATGPFTALEGAGPEVRWKPTAAGSFYLRVEAPGTETYSYTSRTPVAFVAGAADRIRVSLSTAERGDAVTVSLAGVAPAGPFAWSFARLTTGAPGPTTTWTRMPGTGASAEFVATDVGFFAFRTEVPDGAGGFDTFAADKAILAVSESAPIIQSDPPMNIVPPGSSVSLVFRARGIDNTRYNFAWFVGLGPQGPFTLLPIERTEDLGAKRRVWKTQGERVVPGVGLLPGTTPGSYYARVLASRHDGTASYTFTSDAPVVTVIDK